MAKKREAFETTDIPLDKDVEGEFARHASAVPPTVLPGHVEGMPPTPNKISCGVFWFSEAMHKGCHIPATDVLGVLVKTKSCPGGKF